MWIRQMEENDIAAIALIDEDCFLDSWSKNLIRDMYNSIFDETWVLEDNHFPIGYINIRVLGEEAELMRIAVTPKRRGEKLSEILMERMDNFLKYSGVTAVTLEVREHNFAAIRLYEKFGFISEAKREKYYQNPEEDALIMWRREIKC